MLAVAAALSVGGMVELERNHVVEFRTEGVAVPASIQPVLDTLRAHDLHYAFASYWIAWRITFESNLQIVGGKASYSRPFVRNGRVEPGEPPNDRGFWASYYARVDAHRNVAHVFVLGGDVEPKVRPLLRQSRLHADRQRPLRDLDPSRDLSASAAGEQAEERDDEEVAREDPPCDRAHPSRPLPDR